MNKQVSKTPSTFSPEAIAFAQDPIPNPVAPPAGFSQGTNLDKRLAIVRAALNNYDTSKLSSIDIDTATRLDTLFRELEILEKKAADAAIATEANLRNLQSVEQSLQEQLQREQNCGAVGHRRDNGTSAIGGTMIDNHGFVGVCVRCGKNFHGIGNGKDEVSPLLWAGVDTETIGRS